MTVPVREQPSRPIRTASRLGARCRARPAGPVGAADAAGMDLSLWPAV